jgi:hypothetical protein
MALRQGLLRSSAVRAPGATGWAPCSTGPLNLVACAVVGDGGRDPAALIQRPAAKPAHFAAAGLDSRL